MTTPCNFCGRSQADVAHIVVTPDRYAAICGDCIRMCGEAIAAVEAERAVKESIIWPYGSMGEYIEPEETETPKCA